MGAADACRGLCCRVTGRAVGTAAPANPRRLRARWQAGSLVLLASLAASCVSISGGAGDTAPSSRAVHTGVLATAAASASPTGAASAEAGVAATAAASAEPSSILRDDGVTRVGYISLDERVPFAHTVSVSLERAAKAAGVELTACDAGLTRQGALDCAAQLGAAGIDGLISFQAFPDVAAAVCEAVGNVTTVGIAFEQGPCEVTNLRLDQFESGRVAGEAIGRMAREAWQCDVDAYVSLEAAAPEADAAARMEGYRTGFASQCPIDEAVVHVLPGADRVATAATKLGRLLDGLDGHHIVVVGLNEDAILGAIRAARAAGREDDLYYSGQGADPSIRLTIACDPHYVASVAHFPERYGPLSLQALLDLLDGKEVPRTIDAPLQLVTAANVRQIFPDTGSCDA